MKEKTNLLFFFDSFQNFYQLFSNHLRHEESQKKKFPEKQ